MLRCYDVTMLRCVETFQETSALADRLVQDQMKYANQEEELYSLKRKLSLSLQSDPNTSTTTTTPDVLVSCYLCMDDIRLLTSMMANAAELQALGTIHNPYSFSKSNNNNNINPLLLISNISYSDISFISIWTSSPH